MGREAEECTLTFEYLQDGVAHRERVVNTLEREKRKKWYWTHFPVCVLAGIDIPIVSLSLIFAIWFDDVLCISSGAVFGTTVLLCVLSFVIVNREDTFSNPKAACIFCSRVAYDGEDQYYERFNEHEKISRLLVKVCKLFIRRWGKAPCCFWGTFAILFAVSAVTTVFAFFIWPDSTLLCGMGMMVGVGSCVAACLVYAVQILIMLRLRSRQRQEEDDLFAHSECSLFDDGVLVVGSRKCIRLPETQQYHVARTEEGCDGLLPVIQVGNTSIVLSSEGKEQEWWAALARLKKLNEDVK
mgnify:CR=1 FL=1